MLDLAHLSDKSERMIIQLFDSMAAAPMDTRHLAPSTSIGVKGPNDAFANSCAASCLSRSDVRRLPNCGKGEGTEKFSGQFDLVGEPLSRGPRLYPNGLLRTRMSICDWRPQIDRPDQTP